MTDTQEKPVIDARDVIAPKFKQRQRFVDFRQLLGIVAVAFAVLSVLAKFNPYFPLDLQITRFIQHISIPLFPEIMRALTFLGYFAPGSVVVALFMLLAFLMNRKKDALFLLVSVLGTSVIALVVKYLVGRPRPPQDLLLNYPGILSDTSFPSGHVLFYVGLFGFLLFLFHSQLKDTLLRTVLMSVCVLLLLFIGVSRIYLGAHWFSDTLGSYLIGSVWLYIVIQLYKKNTLK